MNKYKNVLSRAIEYYGESAQLDLAMEECAELIQAVNKFKRHGAERLPNLYEEMADVKIVIEQMEIMFDCKSDVENWLDSKVERIAERIGENGYE